MPIGGLSAGKMKSYRPNVSSDFDIQPGQTDKWSFGFLINTDAHAAGPVRGEPCVGGNFEYLLLDRFKTVDVRRVDDAV